MQTKVTDMLWQLPFSSPHISEISHYNYLYASTIPEHVCSTIQKALYKLKGPGVNWKYTEVNYYSQACNIFLNNIHEKISPC